MLPSNSDGKLTHLPQRDVTVGQNMIYVDTFLGVRHPGDYDASDHGA